jgi:fatty-acyl-CoA synthase
MIHNYPDIVAGRFEGYTSPEATERKILRNVFRKGDAWWSSGDLLRCDEDGYCWFVDRIGDTLPLEERERLDHRSGRGFR